MGEEVAAQEFSRADRTRHREKVRRCLDVFARMLREAAFDTDDPMTGLEIELNLVDERGRPGAARTPTCSPRSPTPTSRPSSASSTSRSTCRRGCSRDGGLAAYEENLRASLNDAEANAAEVGAHMVMIGILPTLAEGHMSPTSLAANPRYQLLSDQILAARGEDIAIDIAASSGSRPPPTRSCPRRPAPAPSCTCRSARTTSPAYWNASQAIAGVQLAVGANSPFLLGKELWRETRIPLFEQATDTRSEELKAQGVRPRVWFGERWITSIFDLFEENVRYFPALLPVTEDEDPLEVLERGGAPGCRAAAAQRHDLPLEPPDLRHRRRRAAPARREPRAAGRADRRRHAWPTPPSTSGWCGRWPSASGRCGRRCRSAPPRRTSTPRARHGIDAQVYWPGVGQVPRDRAGAAPAAAAGPRRAWTAWGVDRRRARPAARHHRAALPDRHQRRGVVRDRLHAEGASLERPRGAAADAGGLPRGMHTNEPVHTWDA